MNFIDLFTSFKFKDDSQKKKFEKMFSDFMSELPANLYVNQFDLAKKYPDANYEEWVLFLRHPALDTWKREQISVIAGTETDKALAAGGLKDKEALNLMKARQDILSAENSGTKPTIIVVPESLFFK